MPSLPHAPIPAKSDKAIAHVNNFRHHKKDQRRSAPTLFTSSECFIHIIGIRSCFTAELLRMAAWLQERGIQTVAMQSTGVYWIPLYDILEEHGFEVYLVNARDTKNLPGRKTDVQESQWLLKLHTYGLLRNSFRPTSDIRIVRAYWRQRDQHVKTAAPCIQRIQKALTQMNLQLANVISDLSGKTGLQILRAIVGGERDPEKLVDFRDPRIKANEAPPQTDEVYVVGSRAAR